MRKVKADVHSNPSGKIIWATAEGATIEGHEGYTSTPGYIMVPMKKASSRNKGNDLERIAAKAFSKWLYGREDVLRRTPLSGGWGSGKLGDITIDPSAAKELGVNPPILHVECKHHADLLGESFLRWVGTGSPKEITEWYKQAVREAGDKFVFLVLKGNGTEVWVITGLLEDNDVVGTIHIRTKDASYTAFPLAHLHFTVPDEWKKNILGL